MSRQSRATARLLTCLAAEPEARLEPRGDGTYHICGTAAEAQAHTRIPGSLVRALRTNGLLQENAGGSLSAAPVALAWLKRHADPAEPFRSQHQALETTRRREEDGRPVLINTEESPVAALARRSGKTGKRWLEDHAVAAAERLRSDFETGRLQPRVTANWSASVNRGRRSGNDAGLADLTDMALAARLRFDRAMQAVGPEFSGVLIDVCCFLKGLETVERERQWPARSAKLVLRLGLESLARHYGLSAAASGRTSSGRLRHWGAEDYRPEIM